VNARQAARGTFPAAGSGAGARGGRDSVPAPRHEDEPIGSGARAEQGGTPLVAHIIHRLDYGGLENGLVNLVNRMPRDRYRHAIVCLTEATEFKARITRDAVPVIALHKRPGKDFGAYLRLARVLRTLRPDIVHTRNIGTLDCQLVAKAVGAPHRVHGEHGRDVTDPDGRNRKLRRRRRLLAPFVECFVPMSHDLENWLVETVGIAPSKLVQIYNGVDSERFNSGDASPTIPEGFAGPGRVVIGSVGRMDPIKGATVLAEAFVRLARTRPDARDRLRLMYIGDGPELSKVRDVLDAAGVADLAWLPGARADVPALLRGMDVFVLPSLGEGISNTVLEAMASGLPVVATRVGGNPELVDEGLTGALAAPGDARALAAAIAGYLDDRTLREAHGRAARERVEAHFSLAAMVRGYLALYDRVLATARRRCAAPRN